jgi:hypothetical protein
MLLQYIGLPPRSEFANSIAYLSERNARGPDDVHHRRPPSSPLPEIRPPGNELRPSRPHVGVGNPDRRLKPIDRRWLRLGIVEAKAQERQRDHDQANALHERTSFRVSQWKACSAGGGRLFDQTPAEDRCIVDAPVGWHPPPLTLLAWAYRKPLSDMIFGRARLCHATRSFARNADTKFRAGWLSWYSRATCIAPSPGSQLRCHARPICTFG